MIWAFFLTLGARRRTAGHTHPTEMMIRPHAAAACGARLTPSREAAGNALARSCTSLRCRNSHAIHDGIISESNLDIPQWIIFLGMPLGALLLGGYYVRCISVVLRGGDPFRPGGASGSQ